MMQSGGKKRVLWVFLLFCPIFLVSSILLSNRTDSHKQDFAAYWQAGHMVLSGQNVYDSALWIAVRNQEGTALHSEPTFQYPLPFAILFSPLGLLPVQFAYMLSIFLSQVALLASLLILLSFYPERSGYLELIVVAGIFLFRPTFSVISNGQILHLLLLIVCASVWLFHRERWFLGGFILCVLSLKPSIGIPILVLIGLWLLSRKQWRGILGMLLGGVVTAALGMMVNTRWILDYVQVGGNAFSKYYGMHPTLWGFVDKVFVENRVSVPIGFVCVVAVLAVEVYIFWWNRPNMEAFPAFAIIVPAGLLIAPYSWNYDQILLAVPILFLMITISSKQGTVKAALFLFGMVFLSIGLVVIAYSLGHDVWSFLNSFVVWILSLYAVSRTAISKVDGSNIAIVNTG